MAYQMELLELFQIYLKSLLSGEDVQGELDQKFRQQFQTLCLLEQ